MNNFEARYMKISSAYLSDKLKQLGVKQKDSYVLEDKKESTIHRIVTSIFK